MPSTSATRGVRRSDRVRLGQGISLDRALADSGSLIPELRAWAPVLPPSGGYTGLTAARVHDLWLPPLPAHLPHFVAMGKVLGEVKPMRPELWVSRHPTPPRFVVIEGVKVAPVADTLLACARALGLLDLIVLIDSALHLGRVTMSEIVEVAAQRRWGARLLRLALPFAHGRAESPWEVILEMFHRAVDVPVIPQPDLRTADGTFIARADLLIVGTRTLHEYDGADHRDATRHRRDLRRDRALVSANYIRRGYTSFELTAQSISILRDCDATLGRPHDPRRLDPWLRMLEHSLYAGWGTSPLDRMLLARAGKVDGRRLPALTADTGN